MIFSRALLLLIMVALPFSSSYSAPLEIIEYSKTQSDTLRDLISKLNSRHYSDTRIDDQLSRKFLDHYLDTLDPSRMYFYQMDVDGFRKDALKYDDYFKSGNLAPAFKVYSVFRQRVVSRLELTLELLRDPTVKFEFNNNDEFILDRKNLPWPSTLAEVEESWYQRTKLSILNEKLSGKTYEEAVEKVEKRYVNQLNRIRQQESNDVFEIIANALTTLYDPHTNYFSPRTSENFNISMALKLEGIGAELKTEDEFTTVVRLVVGGPADKQGQLKPKDKITSVGQGDEGEMVDVIGHRLTDVVELIRGKKNTVVKLEVQRTDTTGNEVSRIIRIVRDEVKLADRAAQKAVFEVADGEELYKIGVINLPAFYIDFDAYNRRDPNYTSSTRDVKRLLKELEDENVDGVILDLRNNGGGSLTEATNLTDLFIDQGPVVQIRSPGGRINRYNHSHAKATYRGPLIVLVNRLSASASEIFAGAIQDYKRGLIIGSQSFGKGTVQSVTPLHSGKLKITESKFYRVSGDSTQHRGIVPDIAFPSQYDIEEIGESAYDNALPWDKIHAVPHAQYFQLGAFVPELTTLHEKRAKIDPDFQYLLSEVAMIQENKERKTVSLNEAKRIKEKEDIERKAMELDNRRRKAKGLEPYASLDAYKAIQEEEEELAASEPDKIDVASDPLLNESGNIMADFIRLLNSQAHQHASTFDNPNTQPIFE